MRSFVLSIALAVVIGAVPAANAQTSQGVVAKGPGVAGAARTVEITASITAIDAKSRAITLKGPEGNERTVVAGPEVRNFAQLKVGDQVSVKYLESLVLELKKGSTAVVGRTEQAGGARAAEGAQPGAIVGRKVTVVGEVMEVDAATQTVSVRGPKQTVALKVADPEQFKLIAKGDKIEATYTEALAVTVQPKK